MPTSGGVCQSSCTSTTAAFSTWDGAFNAVSGFAQEGIVWNGQSSYYCTVGPCPPGHTIPPQTWGFFYTYKLNGIYYGDTVAFPSGWSYTDHMYYTIAVYTAKGEYAFRFSDVGKPTSIQVNVCNVAFSGLFSGQIDGYNEQQSPSGTYSGVYISTIDLYDQVLTGNHRSYGPGYVTDLSSPSKDHIYLYGTNQYSLGFVNGSGWTHYSNGYQLWSGSGSPGGTEYFPTDLS